LGEDCFWDEIIDFYKKHQEQKLVIIGDFNVYDLGTEQKKKYLQLLALNAKYAWLEKGYRNSTKTHIKGRRLDYAIMTPTLYECLNSIRIDPVLIENDITDHAALIIEI
jgi:endonuclease/exonuclease/phosphatase family metal-dependent hydrolase